MLSVSNAQQHLLGDRQSEVLLASLPKVRRWKNLFVEDPWYIEYCTLHSPTTTDQSSDICPRRKSCAAITMKKTDVPSAKHQRGTRDVPKAFPTPPQPFRPPRRHDRRFPPHESVP
jgi:hypothetical protein